MSRFGKHPGVHVWQSEPFNAEPALELLAAEITPTSAFYVRGHGDVPAVGEDDHRLSVSGLVENPVTLSLTDLRDRFPERTVLASLQCAGNRRAGLTAVQDIPDEIPWGDGVVGTATWTGVALTDVLAEADLSTSAGHVEFLGLDQVDESGERTRFGGSIPVTKALAAEVLLAHRMNGEPLSPVHGAPLRAIVPGYIGARSVKWLAHIVVREDPSDNVFQARNYKLYPPNVDADTADPDGGLPLGELSINCAICSPTAAEPLSAGPVEVTGYAIAGGHRSITRVDLSADGGRTWQQAELLTDQGPWAWRRWRATLMLRPGRAEIVARAWDTSATTQPETAGPLWNYQGYMNNAWPRLQIDVR